MIHSSSAADGPTIPPSALPRGYTYDGFNCLVRIDRSEHSGWRYWQGDHVACELRTGASGSAQLTWLRAAGQPLAELEAGASPRSILLAADASRSTLLEAGAAPHALAYSPHGYRDDAGHMAAEPAFNGERLDAGSGCYLLGLGHHRPYSPTLGLFLSFDRASPFDQGGLNGLAYCAADPVNRSDPTGHFWKWVLAGVGLALSIVSLGVAAPAVALVAAGGISAMSVAGATAIAGVTLGAVGVGVETAAFVAMGTGNDGLAETLGWVGLGLGVAGLAPALGKVAVKGATKLASKAARFGQRLGRARAPTPTPSPVVSRWGGSAGLREQGGRLWRADLTGGRFTTRPAAPAVPNRWPMTTGVRPNRFQPPAQRPQSLDFGSRRTRPYAYYEMPDASPRASAATDAPGASLNEAVTPAPDYLPGPAKRVAFADQVHVRQFARQSMWNTSIREGFADGVDSFLKGTGPQAV